MFCHRQNPADQEAEQHIVLSGDFRAEPHAGIPQPFDQPVYLARDSPKIDR